MSYIYLDHASTTPCDSRVVEAMQPFFIEKGGNPSSPHAKGRQARRALEESRETMASFIGAQPNEIVFTSGATESNNQAILATARSWKHKGKHIIASSIEHHSVLEPLHLLQEEGFELSLIKPQSDGIVDLKDFETAIRTDTILVCLIHANNEIGTLQPVEELGKICQERGILFLVDATQTVGHLSVDVRNINCDFLSLSAHKFYGPQGVGSLYIRGTNVSSLILGGDQERGRRAGTQNLAGIVGMAQALKICETQMIQSIQQETALRDKIIDWVLKEIPESQLNGHRQMRLANNVHFSFAGIKGEDLVMSLDLAGIGVSMGSACTWGKLEPSHVLKSLGLTDAQALGSLRISIGRGTQEEDVMYFLEQLKIKVKACRNV